MTGWTSPRAVPYYSQQRLSIALQRDNVCMLQAGAPEQGSASCLLPQRRWRSTQPVPEHASFVPSSHLATFTIPKRARASCTWATACRALRRIAQLGCAGALCCPSTHRTRSEPPLALCCAAWPVTLLHTMVRHAPNGRVKARVRLPNLKFCDLLQESGPCSGTYR